MPKFFDWMKKHIIASTAILLGGVAVIVAATAFIVTGAQYAKYSDDYEAKKKVLLANMPQLPEQVFRDNNYVTYDDAAKSVSETKSSYANTYLYTARDAAIDLDKGEPVLATLGSTSWEVATGFKSGGSMTYTINTASNGLSDIDVYLAIGEVKNVPIDNLIDFITIKENGLPVITVDFDLPSDGSLQQLVLKNTNLIKGENTLEFATSVGDASSANNFIMPAIAAVTFITDVDLA